MLLSFVPVLAADSPRHFDTFFRTEYPRLLRVLSAADLSADDALQEAFTKAALSWNRISAYEDPAGWVRKVAVRRMLDERRSSRRKRAAIECKVTEVQPEKPTESSKTPTSPGTTPLPPAAGAGK